MNNLEIEALLDFGVGTKDNVQDALEDKKDFQYSLEMHS